MLLGLVFSLVPRVHSVVLRAFDCFLIFSPHFSSGAGGVLRVCSAGFVLIPASSEACLSVCLPFKERES